MKIIQWAAIAGLALGISACGGAPEEDTNADAVPPRNVVVKQIVPQKLDIQITLPVLVNPTETIELRAAMPGLIVDLPYNEGDVIPASAIPAASWTDLKEYLEISIEGSNQPSDEELSLRNMQYLSSAPSFAKIDNKQLIQSLTEAQVAYDSAVRNLDRAKQYSASTQAQLDAAGVAKVQTRAGVNRVLGMLEDTLICNPRQGVLTKRYRQKGEFVGAGELLGTVAVIDPLKVTVQVPEAHQKALKKGDEVSIWLPSIKEDHKATVTHVGIVAHPTTHSFVVDMALDNTEMKIPGGIFGEVKISVYKADNAIVVPFTAIRLSADDKFVYLESNGVAKEVPVTIGQMSSNGIEVFSDKLKAGDNLITVGAQWLADGDTVRATDADPAEKVQP